MLPRTVGLLYGGSTGFLIVILQSGLTLTEGPGKNCTRDTLEKWIRLYFMIFVDCQTKDTVCN